MSTIKTDANCKLNESEDYKYLHEKLSSIRNVVLRLHSILIWQKSYYGPCIFTFITLIFMCFWLIEIPVISKCCFIGIIVTIIDFLLPFINEMLSTNKWNDDDEKLLNHICMQIVDNWSNIKRVYHLISSWKYSNIKLYYSTLLTSLMLIAWIGTQIHNLFLLYVITMIVALYPGMSHHKLINNSNNYIMKFKLLCDTHSSKNDYSISKNQTKSSKTVKKSN